MSGRSRRGRLRRRPSSRRRRRRRRHRPSWAGEAQSSKSHPRRRRCEGIRSADPSIGHCSGTCPLDGWHRRRTAPRSRRIRRPSSRDSRASPPRRRRLVPLRDTRPSPYARTSVPRRTFCFRPPPPLLPSRFGRRRSRTPTCPNLAFRPSGRRIVRRGSTPIRPQCRRPPRQRRVSPSTYRTSGSSRIRYVPVDNRSSTRPHRWTSVPEGTKVHRTGRTGRTPPPWRTFLRDRTRGSRSWSRQSCRRSMRPVRGRGGEGADSGRGDRCPGWLW
mmetsp:Transcript_41566/g.126001  ORF Transcript_41566/g.126001 Transcript_41566/m.126001 type:complete len:273 (-) Transcript_41566:20-838(-)